ncbi:hypothetical protein N879_03815 [Alcaligenes sp. EGD-AK7]|nr:hypothetical protein N879_03815 [Alcaligenes sp. EGD-AK7]
MRLQSLNRILGASWIKAATWPQQWANKKLIAANKQDQNRDKNGFHRSSQARERHTRSNGHIVSLLGCANSKKV